MLHLLNYFLLEGYGREHVPSLLPARFSFIHIGVLKNNTIFNTLYDIFHLVLYVNFGE